jgi:type I restriction enzyme R subunit
MVNIFTESEIEVFSLDQFKALGFGYIPGPMIAPESFDAVGIGEMGSEQAPLPLADGTASYGEAEKRESYEEVVLKPTLERAINKLNPALPESARQEALKAVLSIYSPQLITANEAFHKMLTEGVPVNVRKDGQERGERVWLVDFQNP